MRTTFSRLLLGAAFVTSAASAHAADVRPADAPAEDKIAEGSTIVVTATKANEIAPVTASLDTTQPQAIVSRSFIQDSLPTAADFNQIALITPSVSNYGATNGIGLSESKAVIRGFQDAEYNITYDGVPFGDQNDPTHHSNTFFPSNTIETLVVDRGPGNASQLGQATFGGNINLFSREVRDTPSAELLGSYGTFNTFAGQALLQSGAIDSLRGAKFVVSAQIVRSDGALSLEKYRQLNFFAKTVIPIGPDVRLSLIGTANRNVFNQADNDGITLAQAAAFGKRYALSNDPNTQNYFAYNSTVKTTDFYIARLEADIAPLSQFTNSAYTYKYDNETLSGLDVTGATANLVTPASGGAKVFGVPGYTKTNKYRVYGDIAKLHLDFGFGAVTVGGWIEHSDTFRQQTEINLLNAAPNYRLAVVTAPASGLRPGEKTPGYVRFNQNSSFNQTEEFIELELRPLDGLRITPGFKHVDINRRIDALYNQTTRYAQRLSSTDTANLPFLTVNYQGSRQLAFYGQYAEGFQAPFLNTLYVARPELSNLEPQRSTNYQVGAVYHGPRLSLDFDLYSIDFTNKVSSSTSPVPGEGVIFTNLGGALYKGVEGQATYAFAGGLALFANASYNYAKVKGANPTQVARAPFTTAAAGILYKDGPVRFSLVDKFTGTQYGAEGEPVAFRIGPYHNTFMSGSYDLDRVRLGVKVSDLFDTTNVTQISGTQYYFQPGRQITGEVTVRF